MHKKQYKLCAMMRNVTNYSVSSHYGYSHNNILGLYYPQLSIKKVY